MVIHNYNIIITHILALIWGPYVALNSQTMGSLDLKMEVGI